VSVLHSFLCLFNKCASLRAGGRVTYRYFDSMKRRVFQAGRIPAPLIVDPSENQHRVKEFEQGLDLSPSPLSWSRTAITRFPQGVGGEGGWNTLAHQYIFREPLPFLSFLPSNLHSCLLGLVGHECSSPTSSSYWFLSSFMT